VNFQQQNNEIGRKNPATGVHIQSGRPNFVLLTVTTKDRTPWLANPVAHELLREAWLVSDYLLMPDHLHLYCAPLDPQFKIEQWIVFWKRDFRRRHENKNWKFQPRGWHHRLRDDENYSSK
jgi:putative transposase